MDWREQLAEIKTKIKPIEPASAKQSRSQTAGVSVTTNTTTVSKKQRTGRRVLIIRKKVIHLRTRVVALIRLQSNR